MKLHRALSRIIEQVGRAAQLRSTCRLRGVISFQTSGAGPGSSVIPGPSAAADEGPVAHLVSIICAPEIVATRQVTSRYPTTMDNIMMQEYAREIQWHLTRSSATKPQIGTLQFGSRAFSAE